MKRYTVLVILCFVLAGCGATLSGNYYSVMKEEMRKKPSWREILFA